MSGTGAEPAGPAPATGDLQARLAQKSAEAEDLDAAIERETRRQESRDRSVVTGTILTVFFVAVPLSLVALLLLSFLSKDAAPEAIKATASILKDVLLPIMTLVLGYYFGRGGRG
jgi:hypothetical protein